MRQNQVKIVWDEVLKGVLEMALGIKAVSPQCAYSGTVLRGTQECLAFWGPYLSFE